jgi:Cell division protein FtsQ/DivIB, C-terminal
VRRRWALAGGLLLAALAAAAYVVLLSGSTVEPDVRVVVPTSVIGAGDEAVGVAADGTLLSRQPPPAEGSVPSLPLSAPPKGGRLAGPVLEQARVLGAAPPPLRQCIERSYYGESGVDVVLRSGIELRFGGAAQAEQKWRSAAAVLADPSITVLDYVDLHSPARPTVGGSEHGLPPAEQESAGGCGD